MAMDANIRRKVKPSPKNTMPPKAAMTGTLSCTVAACVAFRDGKAVYQMAYPMPEVSAPDVMA